MKRWYINVVCALGPAAFLAPWFGRLLSSFHKHDFLNAWGSLNRKLPGEEGNVRTEKNQTLTYIGLIVFFSPLLHLVVVELEPAVGSHDWGLWPNPLLSFTCGPYLILIVTG